MVNVIGLGCCKLVSYLNEYDNLHKMNIVIVTCLFIA